MCDSSVEMMSSTASCRGHFWAEDVARKMRVPAASWPAVAGVRRVGVRAIDRAVEGRGSWTSTSDAFSPPPTGIYRSLPSCSECTDDRDSGTRGGPNGVALGRSANERR
jgi:hypothetical protein